VRLLIIDDDPHIVRALTLLFEHAGYEVLTAHNGVRGLEQLLAARPDMAIIDVMMPGMSGMDVLRTWGSQKQATDNTQFILLTASCDEEIQTFAQHCANVRFVAKPFSPKKILSMVQATREASTIEQSQV
jgi:DNA-binding response OmpR family regulator